MKTLTPWATPGSLSRTRAINSDGPVVGGANVAEISVGPETGGSTEAAILVGPETGGNTEAVRLVGPKTGGNTEAAILVGPETGGNTEAVRLVGPKTGLGGTGWHGLPPSLDKAGLRYFERTESLIPSKSASTKQAFREPPYLGQFLEYICSEVLEFFTLRVSCRFFPRR